MAALRQELGRRIRALRKGRGWTQEELAAKAGVDYKWLGSVERGERNVTINNVERIARGLGVEALQLFMFTSSGEERPERLAQAKIVDALKRSDPRTNEALLRIVHEVLRLGGGA